MRLSSVTLPSCIGTLKSTRIRTRLPLRSISFTVFLFMAYIKPCEGSRPSGSLRKVRTLKRFRYKCREISSATGITPFVVVPCYDLHHVADDKRIHGTIYCRVIRSTQIGGNQRFISDIKDSLHRALCILKHRIADFFLTGFLVQDRSEIHNRDCRGWHTKSHTTQYAFM